MRSFFLVSLGNGDGVELRPAVEGRARVAHGHGLDHDVVACLHSARHLRCSDLILLDAIGRRDAGGEEQRGVAHLVKRGRGNHDRKGPVDLQCERDGLRGGIGACPVVLSKPGERELFTGLPVIRSLLADAEMVGLVGGLRSTSGNTGDQQDAGE